MPYNPADRSELELRFEHLFQQVFGCPIESLLIPQYPVEINGQLYRIDYAYVTDTDYIAIELDGHGKIKGASNSKEEFKKLLSRQNDIVQAGFTIYRFTWDDVVRRNGWVAKKRLREVFEEKFETQNKSSSLRGLVPLDFPGIVQSILPKAKTQEETSSINTTEVLYHLPSTEPLKRSNISKDKIVLYAGFSLFLGVLVMLLLKSPIPTSEQTKPQVIPQIIESEPSEAVKALIQIEPSRDFQNQVNPDRKAVNHIHPEPIPIIRKVAHNTKILLPKPTQIDVPPQAIEPPKSVAPINESPSEQIVIHEPAEVDEMVVFNQSTLIYHQPHCFWAKKCTQNCVSIRKSEAINLGGRAAKSCNPR